ncbi:pyridoxal phosphate-dependent aminotransferase [Desulfovirgula thermocuniculi]|uniref:pyridoxal phosphate-dependent aminotransferase n=1 Tax=Desulfovirgula thermocuniculi TaxID=348842 RepID=UPI000408E186|nr:pyridoxal phosphate-dependent aminotransferase [Desulfovirgula thermocuniculi]
MAVSQKIRAFLSEASWIRRMFEEGEKLRAVHGPDRVYDFTLGNPEVEPPAAFKAALQRLAANPIPGMHRYMSNAGYEETRAAIAEVLAQDTGLPFRAKHVIMTVGAAGALNVVLKAILEPGDEVIVFTPYFVEYGFYVDNHGGVLKKVPTGQGFLPDAEALERAITPRTRAVLINSPNNPTGVVYGEGCLEGICRVIRQKEKELGRAIYLISDEPYAKLVYDGARVPCVFHFTRNSVVVTSHSKDLALPGERIGYIAVHPEMEEADLLIEGLIFCNRILGFVNAPALMQRLVAGLQRERVDVEGYREKRDLLYNHLVSLGFEVVKPQGAFYLFPKSPLPDDVEFVRLAQKYLILVVPGRGFGQPGHFRVSYCVRKEVIVNSLPAWTQLARELGMEKSPAAS